LRERVRERVCEQKIPGTFAIDPYFTNAPTVKQGLGG
jgi:hypothetical protein